MRDISEDKDRLTAHSEDSHTPVGDVSFMQEQGGQADILSQEQHDEKLINEAFRKLLDTYLASNHRKKVERITKAFNFAKQAHKGVRRLSGEPYILHPIAVAQIACGEIGLGSTSICAALLHDVEEDTDYTNEDIANLFGQKVADIVEGLTKISGGVFGESASLQAETFKKLLLTMSDDVRVILIKISDRLHNMRTLSSMAPGKQYKIAGETLYIYAPLADRLGLNKIKSELEDLSFRYEHPEEYQRIVDMLATTQEERSGIFTAFVPPIKDALDAMGFKYHILQRIKTPYSIWSKMQNKHVAFDEVYDILAIRIIFAPKDKAKEVDEAFSIYGALTKIYRPHPARFRDWLSTPKANGYQALHNTFMSSEGRWIEVQIRSERMDDIAERGFAAHWKYKEGDVQYDESELDKWLDSIKEILDDPQPDTIDLLDTIKLNLFSEEILVFTPKGEIRTMPNKATVLDFAFSIHSFLGCHCFGAKVNHKLVPFSYRLKSGDQVEVLTSRTQKVTSEWLEYATTAKARGKIQAILRHEHRENVRAGEQLVRDFLTSYGLDSTTTVLERLRVLHGVESREALCLLVQAGKVTLGADDVRFLQGRYRKRGWRKYVPFISAKTIPSESRPAQPVTLDFVQQLNRKQTLVLNEGVLEKCEIASCCHPLPGDDVLGYITLNNTLEIHKRKCPTAMKLKARYGNNIIAAVWDTHGQREFEATVYIRGVDGRGVLYAISDLLHQQEHINLRHVAVDTNKGMFEGTLSFLVHDAEEVDDICRRLMQIENIEKAYRIDQ